MKKQFDFETKVTGKMAKTISTINTVLEDYREQGYTLTLRQLYYQLVTKNIIPNEDRQYKKLSRVLKMGRMCGLVDWDSIEDRVRVPKRPYWVHGIQDAIEDTVANYRLDRMSGQERRVEIWLEKDALSSILYRVSAKYHIRLMVNRGYSSVSAMYEASKRLRDKDIILYFGDHDPSGLDMVRDIEDRLFEFGKDVEVRPVALTMEQIRKYDPPVNPAKLSDTRSRDYIAEHGEYSWELDAIEPKELERISEEAVLDCIDIDIYNSMVDKEEEEKLKIERATIDIE